MYPQSATMPGCEASKIKYLMISSPRRIDTTLLASVGSLSKIPILHNSDVTGENS